MDNRVRTGFIWNTTEQEETPITVDKYLSNDKYHHSLKGCDCEIAIKQSTTYKQDDKYYNLMINKKCKTHNVMCSKTGWELGYYMGTNSSILDRYFNCKKCGCEFIVNIHSRLVYCKKCKEELRVSKIKKVVKPSNCKVCGKAIESKNNGIRIYCKECALKVNKEQCKKRNTKHK